jgi:ribose transport system permease protein
MHIDACLREQVFTEAYMKLKIRSKTVRKLISVGLVLALALLFAVTTDAFLSVRNITMLLKDSAYLGLIALGVSVVIVGGGIDLSGGGIVCVVGILTSRLTFTGLPGFIVLVIGVILGGVCGIINGLLVASVHLTEFVATLATGFVFAGMGLLFAFRSNGKISGTLVSKSITNKSFLAMGKHMNGVYYITIVWIVMTILSYFVLMRTKFGLHTYALGSHAKSAEMSGVNTARQRALCFVISGAFAGLASVMVVANMGAAAASLGSGYEFQAIAACVVGGVMLGGGKGDTIGAFVGSIFMILVLNGLYKFGLPTYWQYIFQGAIIIIATAFDAQFAKFAQKRRSAESAARAAA